MSASNLLRRKIGLELVLRIEKDQRKLGKLTPFNPNVFRINMLVSANLDYLQD